MNINLKNITIFVTGGSVLALELLGSRIMTPYFGVSLYIWTGILSITLISLSLGYYLGGRLASRITKAGISNSKGKLEYLFCLMPAISSIAIGLSCLAYPSLFFILSQQGLVVGSFLASIILLFIPLIATSSMNPILIAIQSIEDKKNGYDDHAGKVFFISTLGSVIGVIFTAFVFIPNMTNFRSSLLLGVILSTLSIITALTSKTTIKKNIILIISAVGLILCLGLAIFANSYLKKDSTVKFNDYDWSIAEEYTSLFGNTKVLHINDGKRILYVQDGFIQVVIDDDWNSREAFTYILEKLILSNKPNAKSVLIIGLAGGVIPKSIYKNNPYKDINIDAVDINPNSIEIAKKYFNFKDQYAKVFIEDARTYVKTCTKNKYDAVILDYFQGDGSPEYLMTREFFTDLKQCTNKNSIVVMNTFANLADKKNYYHVVKTVNSVFKNITMFHQDLNTNEDSLRNIFIVATDGEPAKAIDTLALDTPQSVMHQVSNTLGTTRPIDKKTLQEVRIITDENNFYQSNNASQHMQYRKAAITIIPPEFLVN